jgi:enamine deaminase RidA (YjgF/YER057c/UK114 family)
MNNTILQPEGWAPPIGYANGVAARGRFITVAGQVGWNAQCKWESDELVDQVRQTLQNIVAVLAAGGAKPEHITSLTWYLVDKRDYLAKLKQIGEVYRAVIGRNFPAMTAVQVVALIEDRAKVEIQATAVIPD